MAVLAASAVAAVLFLAGLGNHVLWDYHEPHVGGIVQEMTRHGAWLVPTLGGQPFLEKPPLFHWMAILSCKLAGGMSCWALRLPSALMAIATVAWVSWLAARARTARAGLLVGLMTATLALFLQMGHRATVDLTFTATVTLALGLAWLALTEAVPRWLPLFWASLGLTFLAKGVVGPVLVLVAVLTATLILDRRRLPGMLRPNWGMALGLALALAWVVPLALRGGPAHLEEVFLRNSLGRFFQHPGLVPATGTLEEHREPWWFYAERLPGNLLPWLPLWLTALASLPWRRPRLADRLLPVLFLAGLALLSLSSAKRMVYLLPLLPITCLDLGLWLDRELDEGPGRAARWALALTVAVVLLLGLALPWFVHLRAGLDPAVAAAMTLLALVAGGPAAVLAAWRRWPQALHAAALQGCLTALAFLLLAVPALDREWNPLLEPYQMAKALQDQGARVYQGRLGENQVGFVNLTFGHALTPVRGPEDLRAALARPGPVVFLLEARLLREGAFGPAREDLAEVPTDAAASDRLRDRAPALLLNAEAMDALEAR